MILWLSHLIGGTTTDIAILHEGQPRIDGAGATVGGHRTMVDAVAIRTFGLGGDSEVTIDEGALEPTLMLGPRRLVPVSLLAATHRSLVMDTLTRQLKATTAGRTDGRFAFAAGLPDHHAAGLSQSQKALLSRMSSAPQPLDLLLQGTSELATLNTLVGRGLAHVAGLTPSDAQHALGAFAHWDQEAAALAVELFARKKDGNGKPLSNDPKSFAHRIVARLKRLSAESVLSCVLHEDGLDGTTLIRSPLIARALDRTNAMARMAIILDRPLIGLGAGASSYYPDAGDILGVECVVPKHADVANAIGAVVGQVRVHVSAEIIPSESQHFLVTGSELNLTKSEFFDEADAIAAARAACLNAVELKAQAAGSMNVSTQLKEDIKHSEHDGRRLFISAKITALASGRPSIN